jgi:stage IV sporulation protein FB
MLQEPGSSPYDLHFNFLGFDTRVTWGFWVAAVVLGWGWCTGLDRLAAHVGMDSPGAPVLLVIWSGAILLSILVHELGHALAMRRFGVRSRLVLYHFGGLAIADSFGAWDGARRAQLTPRDSLIIAASGPCAQLLLAGVVFAAGRAVGMSLDVDQYLATYLGMSVPETDLPSSAAAYAIFNFIIMPSLWWALLNLLPILPLDGGNILMNALQLNNVRDARRVAHFVSIGVAVLAGIYSMQSGDTMFGMFCLMFAASNWQQLQMLSGRF